MDDLMMGWDGMGWSSGSRVWMGGKKEGLLYLYTYIYVWVGVMERVKIPGVGFQLN